jgi:hypothetical protein
MDFSLIFGLDRTPQGRPFPIALKRQSPIKFRLWNRQEFPREVLKRLKLWRTFVGFCPLHPFPAPLALTF